MCCRYYVLPADPELEAMMEAAFRSPLLPRFAGTHSGPLVRSGEVAPSNLAAVIASNRRQQAAVFPMSWGFRISGRSALLVNARVETAPEKPSFREAWLGHRCAVPASWYFEWQHRPAGENRPAEKVKYAIRPKDPGITWLCGLYRIENGLPAFVILTRSPSQDVAMIHDRMPLILPGQAVRDWVNPAVRPEDLLPYAVTALQAEQTA